MVDTAISMRGLSYAYPDGKQVLRGIDLDIHPGESVGIIGANGAGKTTLLLHLNGILTGEGKVTVLGVPVTPQNMRFVRSRVGFVFQNPDDQLFSPTVFDDVAFGPLNLGLPPADVTARVRKALADLGMQGYERSLPHHLSSGEKKKISIATVLSLPLEILVLDEPTSNLDPGARRLLISALKKLSLTKVIASHDSAMVAEVCGRVIELEEGRIASDRTAAKFSTGKWAVSQI